MAENETIENEAPEANGEEKKAPRNRIADKVYVLTEADESTKSGFKESRSASPDVQRLEFRFADGETVAVTLDEIGESCRRAAAWHGVSQKLGDGYAGASSPEEAREGGDKIQGFLTILERLQSDDWVKEREGGGPRPSLLVEAVVRVLEEHGETVDDARRERIRETIKAEDGRKKTMANPKFAAAYEKIRTERQQAKQAEAEKKAADAPVDLGGF